MLLSSVWQSLTPADGLHNNMKSVADEIAIKRRQIPIGQSRMVIIITGSSHVGKTLLAQRMLEKNKFPCLSIDHLKMGLIRSGITNLTPEDDDELTDYLWPIVREIMKTAIENKQNLIVEGCYIPFEWRNSFDDEYLQSIRFICLAMSDEYIDSHFEEIRSHSSDIEKRLDDSYCTAEQLKEDNHQIMDGYRSAGEKITLITKNYEDSIMEVLDKINNC